MYHIGCLRSFIYLAPEMKDHNLIQNVLCTSVPFNLFMVLGGFVTLCTPGSPWPSKERGMEARIGKKMLFEVKNLCTCDYFELLLSLGGFLKSCI